MLKQFHLGKVILGLLFASCSLAILYFSHHLVIASIALAGVALAGYEISEMLGRNLRQRLMQALAIIVACLVSFWILSRSRESFNEFMFMALIVWLVVAPLSLIRPLHPSKQLQGTIWSFYLVSTWLAVVVLAEYDRWLLIFGLIGIWMIDTVAWFVGSRFGKKKLAPKISPNKNWEGVYGALVFMLLFISVLWSYFEEGEYSVWLVLVIASTITALATLGDLVESAFKRSVGVKDSSNVLGSHGGVLDRIDSWLPNLPFIALLSTFN